MEDKKNPFAAILPVAGAIFLLIASVTYIYARAVSNRNYIRKWEDYDECGIF